MTRVSKITLIDPDVYKPHNVVRHYFPVADAGQKKVDLAAGWVKQLRPDLEVVALPYDLTDLQRAAEIDALISAADIGICAVDVEPAKYHFDVLMRKHGKSWTLGEVLSGGIGGWVHCFRPGEACYGCVASHLQCAIETDNSPPPDYSDPQAAVERARIPASKTSIGVIAAPPCKRDA